MPPIGSLEVGTREGGVVRFGVPFGSGTNASSNSAFKEVRKVKEKNK